MTSTTSARPDPDWLVGPVKESVAIDKLKPMLESKPARPTNLRARRRRVLSGERGQRGVRAGDAQPDPDRAVARRPRPRTGPRHGALTLTRPRPRPARGPARRPAPGRRARR